MRTVQDFVHEPERGVWGTKDRPNDPDRCQFSVAEHRRITTWHQCNRKIVEEIDGFGFCKQHAEEVNQKLGRLTGEIVRYIAEFRDSPALVKALLSSETENTFNLVSRENIIGSMSAWAGKQRKDSQYWKHRVFFEDYGEALNWLYDRSVQKMNKSKKEYDESVETMHSLAHMVYEYKERE